MKPDPTAERWLSIGVILKPHGVRGEVKVQPTTDDPRRFKALKQAHCRLKDGSEQELTVASARQAGQYVLLRFAQYSAPEAARVLQGGTLLIPRSQAMPLKEGHVYYADVIDLPVVDTQGQPRGTVREVMASPAQDLLVLDTPHGERMVPWVEALVRVSLEEGRIIVQDLPGLLDE